MNGPSGRIVPIGLVLAAALAASGCASGETTPALPAGYFLVQKQQFQALYNGEGRMERLLQDRNRDGRADAVIVFHPNGKPRRGELDTDEDGKVDRWEMFRSDGTLEMIGSSRARNGQPDTWEYAQ